MKLKRVKLELKKHGNHQSTSYRCSNKCASKVSIAERKRIFKEFYKLACHDAQNKYLYGLIEHLEPKTKKAKVSNRKENKGVI